jgi:hypothetical protein
VEAAKALYSGSEAAAGAQANATNKSATKRPMNIESPDWDAGSIFVGGLLLCIPLFVLFVSSLVIIALKRISRLPRWAARLAAPPFYFVSLPVATVIATSEIVAWISLGLYLFYGPYLSGASGREYAIILSTYFFVGQPLLTLLVGGSFAWMLVSICLLWRTLRQERGQGSVSKNAQQRLRALLLLLAFMWPWASIGYLIHLATRP